MCPKCFKEMQNYFESMKKESENQFKLLKIELTKSTNENVFLKQKCEKYEQNIKKFLSGDQLRQLQKQIAQMKQEKELFLKQQKLDKVQFKKDQEAIIKEQEKKCNKLLEQINQLNQELKQYQDVDEKVKDLEDSLSQLIIENNNLKQKINDNEIFNKTIFNQQEAFFRKLKEIQQRINQNKLLTINLISIANSLSQQKIPNLEDIIQNQEKIIVKEEYFMPKYNLNDLNELFNFEMQIQVESSLVINETMKLIKDAMHNFQNKFISEIGMHLVSFN